jgi:hypothetical protein
MAPVPAATCRCAQKVTYALVALLVVLAGVGWWWFHRPAPAYKVQDPGDLSLSGPERGWKDDKVGLHRRRRKGSYPAGMGCDCEQCYFWPNRLRLAKVFAEFMKDGKWGYIDTGGHLVDTRPVRFCRLVHLSKDLQVSTWEIKLALSTRPAKYVINPQF